MEPLLALVANSKDGTLTTLRIADDTLTEVSTTVVAPGLPLAVDRARGLVFAGTSDPRGVTRAAARAPADPWRRSAATRRTAPRCT